MKVRLTRPALDDLERIQVYISKDNPAAASRVVTRLIDRAMELAQAPYRGREVDEPNARDRCSPLSLFYFLHHRR
jgi:toxin ParE1/3/4